MVPASEAMTTGRSGWTSVQPMTASAMHQKMGAAAMR